MEGRYKEELRLLLETRKECIEIRENHAVSTVEYAARLSQEEIWGEWASYTVLPWLAVFNYYLQVQKTNKKEKLRMNPCDF